MVEGWLRREANLVPHGRGHAARRNDLAGIGEHDLGWTGTLLQRAFPRKDSGRGAASSTPRSTSSAMRMTSSLRETRESA